MQSTEQREDARFEREAEYDRIKGDLEPLLLRAGELVVQSLTAEEVAVELRFEIETMIPRVAGRILRRNLRNYLFPHRLSKRNGR